MTTQGTFCICLSHQWKKCLVSSKKNNRCHFNSASTLSHTNFLNSNIAITYNTPPYNQTFNPNHYLLEPNSYRSHSTSYVPYRKLHVFYLSVCFVVFLCYISSIVDSILLASIGRRNRYYISIWSLCINTHSYFPLIQSHYLLPLTLHPHLFTCIPMSRGTCFSFTALSFFLDFALKFCASCICCDRYFVTPSYFSLLP
jgi:hypothetical protein